MSTPREFITANYVFSPPTDLLRVPINGDSRRFGSEVVEVDKILRPESADIINLEHILMSNPGLVGIAPVWMRRVKITGITLRVLRDPTSIQVIHSANKPPFANLLTPPTHLGNALFTKCIEDIKSHEKMRDLLVRHRDRDPTISDSDIIKWVDLCSFPAVIEIAVEDGPIGNWVVKFHMALLKHPESRFMISLIGLNKWAIRCVGDLALPRDITVKGLDSDQVDRLLNIIIIKMYSTYVLSYVLAVISSPVMIKTIKEGPENAFLVPLLDALLADPIGRSVQDTAGESGLPDIARPTLN